MFMSDRHSKLVSWRDTLRFAPVATHFVRKEIESDGISEEKIFWNAEKRRMRT